MAMAKKTGQRMGRRGSSMQEGWPDNRRWDYNKQNSRTWTIFDDFPDGRGLAMRFDFALEENFAGDGVLFRETVSMMEASWEEILRLRDPGFPLDPTVTSRLGHRYVGVARLFHCRVAEAAASELEGRPSKETAVKFVEAFEELRRSLRAYVVEKWGLVA